MGALTPEQLGNERILGALRLENHPEEGWRYMELTARIVAALDRAAKRQVDAALSAGNDAEARRVADAYLATRYPNGYPYHLPMSAS